MRLSCSVTCLPKHALVEAMQAISRAGFAAVEVCSAFLREAHAHDTEAVDHLRRLLERSDLTISSITIPPLSATSVEDLPHNIEIIHREMQLARAAGLSAVNVGAGDRGRQSIELLTHGLREIIAIARDLGMQVNLANARGSRIQLPSDIRYVLAEASAERVRLMLDAGQFHSVAVNPCDVLCEFPGRIGLIHLTDQIGRKPVPIGRGEMNVPAIVERAFRTDYAGWIVVANPVPDDADPVHYLREAKAYLERLAPGWLTGADDRNPTGS